MAAPNIVNVNTITGKTFSNTLTTSNAIIIANASSSGKVYKVNSVLLANLNGNTAFDVTVELNKAAAGSGAYNRLASTISVPGDSTLVLVDKTTSFYMEENTSLKGFASSNSNVDVIVSYEEIS